LKPLEFIPVREDFSEAYTPFGKYEVFYHKSKWYWFTEVAGRSRGYSDYRVAQQKAELDFHARVKECIPDLLKAMARLEEELKAVSADCLDAQRGYDKPSKPLVKPTCGPGARPEECSGGAWCQYPSCMFTLGC
jgi:hypothetical protein